MKINEAGIKLIKQFEGCVLHVYLDAVGVKTVGYGHTGADVNKMKTGTPISQTQADRYLEADLIKFENQVMFYNDKYHWNENEFSALVSFAYNVGSIHGLTNRGARSKAEISQKMEEYVYAGGKRLAGLVKRRQAERELFNKNSTVKSNVPNYVVGESYTIHASSLGVRRMPSLNAQLVPYRELTLMAQVNSVNKTSYIKGGTRVTCKSKQVDVEGNVWIKTPSGWMCAYLISRDEVYIK